MTETERPHDRHYSLRDELVAGLRRDLLGPAGGEEEVLAEDAPITAYPMGVLFPQPEKKAAGETELDLDVRALDGGDTQALLRGVDREEADADFGVSLANRRKPSSIGLTFTVDPGVGNRLTVLVKAAVYEPTDADGRPISVSRAAARSTDEQRERWVRRPLVLEPRTIDVSRPGLQEPPNWSGPGSGLKLHVLVREPDPATGTVTVTVTLVNTLEIDQFALQDAHCFFQPEMEIRGAGGGEPFVERPVSSGAVDEEQAASRMLFRHMPTFATGHGCAAHWDWVPPGLGERHRRPPATASVRTEFVPTHEVLLTDSNPDIDNSALAMQKLAEAPTADIVSALYRLTSGYAEWIEARSREVASPALADHAEAAERQLAQCREALFRMRRGVELLADTDRPDIMRAFRLANEAMAQQRARSSWVKEGRPGEPDRAAVEKERWRPFQVSFMLLCLEGIVDPASEDRGISDLLWFPTGGGKTEAYLGLIAFTVFLRRLRDGAMGGGVTVLMRYTLRLLTLQQFQRAATLICALEALRRAHPRELGDEPVSIGMWVGASATPNTLAAASTALSKLRRGNERLQRENPVQLHTCPWCGTPLDEFAYEVDEGRRRMDVRCPTSACAFNDGLPVHLVDEAVYDAHPTLIIATVDKFASMPWKPESAALFNRDREDCRPPELIVQDELHLISGPLGTLTGLYETAVDILADRPKVIASTATIRRATDQGRRLFHREVRQFPPAGLDARDSWFAVETPRGRKAARRYVGLLTPSTSQATLLIRAYAALLHQAAASDAPERVCDAYWTLVGYFNSLRLLAAAELQVLDDVQDRLEFLAVRDKRQTPRKVRQLTELTSRADSSDIPIRLAQVERALPHPDTLDVLLATNMISVGVDIDRLGLMAVTGQPQTTAEYIQATSRVGRRHPGLVLTLFNSARSRDRSHYEGFLHFHSALYREVESTSVTPFSTRARDRGLHAVIVSLARLLIPAARNNDRAAHLEDFRPELEDLLEKRVLARVRDIDEAEYEDTALAIDEFLNDWHTSARNFPDLVYVGRPGTRQPALLHAFEENAGRTAWETLWSLRDVDAESALFLEVAK
ncbi:helicase-related protein [Streptomyces aidingensis]|uniref:Helicase conserved C-terminal domain-containing protein n=1 Tax=Streptomyces aidingensis TaxID=910347 RepID=A0A1I1U279_9ACTN|nr:helicase-related protein [Streptomyces aidingensis]SFD62793.1 Helicase conserved C-terminal domain-containing protein [Streptomyces aidingensis]